MIKDRKLKMNVEHMVFQIRNESLLLKKKEDIQKAITSEIGQEKR
jgi:hypothetical protein